MLHAYRVFDTTKKGFISAEDLNKIFLKLNCHERINTDEILKKMDYNNDGKVCFKGRYFIKIIYLIRINLKPKNFQILQQ